MKNESKKNLIKRLKGITNKLNVHSYKEEFSDENASLILFSEFLKKANEGIEFILEEGFNESNQYRIEHQIISVVSHIFRSSLLFYSMMFRGGNGVRRENLLLKENRLFNSDGNEKKQKNGSPSQPKQDRFHIEEFFISDSVEFKIHHKIMFQVDKSITHIDETDLTSCYTLLLFDKKETNKYLGIDNYFEHSKLPNKSELIELSTLFVAVQDKVNQKIRKNATLIHESIQKKDEYNTYFHDLIINENEC